MSNLDHDTNLVRDFAVPALKRTGNPTPDLVPVMLACDWLELYRTESWHQEKERRFFPPHPLGLVPSTTPRTGRGAVPAGPRVPVQPYSLAPESGWELSRFMNTGKRRN